MTKAWNLAVVRDKARLEAEDTLKAKVAERETQIAGMQRQIEELRRKAEQGSQRLQGEAPGAGTSTTASLICSALNAVRWERDSMDIVAGV
jgi:hypothetical protein